MLIRGNRIIWQLIPGIWPAGIETRTISAPGLCAYIPERKSTPPYHPSPSLLHPRNLVRERPNPPPPPPLPSCLHTLWLCPGQQMVSGRGAGREKKERGEGRHGCATINRVWIKTLFLRTIIFPTLIVRSNTRCRPGFNLDYIPWNRGDDLEMIRLRDCEAWKLRCVGCEGRIDDEFNDWTIGNLILVEFRKWRKRISSVKEDLEIIKLKSLKIVVPFLNN